MNHATIGVFKQLLEGTNVNWREMSSSKWLLHGTRVPVFFEWSPERKSRISSVLVTGSLLVGDQAKEIETKITQREKPKENGEPRGVLI